jgi:hypothetical protein
MAGEIGILGGLALGVLVALFAPFVVSVICVVALIVIIILPQFPQYKIPAAMGLLAIIGVTIIRVYVWKQTVTL